MTETILIGLASIIVLGVLAQWMAWRLHLPSILLLLICGFVAGPATGILDPDAVFSDLLFPLVSVSVAIILFEGGLSLKISELRQGRSAIFRLVSVGILITWVLAAAFAYLVAGLELSIAVLVGAILVVSGPTVIIPLLRQVRPVGRVGSIVKWEGIVNDPIGAILAVLVFEVILTGGGTGVVVGAALRAFLFGSLIGLLGAVVVVLFLKRYIIPDFLQNPVSLMLVVLCYVAANALQHEAGLLAVTVMGIALANQRFVSIRHILEFKENLRVLLISSLFIILAARIPLSEVALDHPWNWVYVLILIVIVRPAAVFGSLAGTNIPLRQKSFISWMAPRGIVAAAVASVFAIRLADAGVEGAEAMIPLTFQVIIGTVAVYGLTASPVARWLKLAQPNPQGVLIAGAQPWARQLASALEQEGFKTALVDSNWSNVAAARKSGLTAYYANILSEDLLFELQLDGIGKLFAMTPNDEVNSLATLHFVDIFDRSGVYQLVPANTGAISTRAELPKHLRGRYLFDDSATYQYFQTRFNAGAVIKRTLLTDEFDYDAFVSHYKDSALPLSSVSDAGILTVYTTDTTPSPSPGYTLIALVDPVAKEPAPRKQPAPGEQQARLNGDDRR